MFNVIRMTDKMWTKGFYTLDAFLCKLFGLFFSFELFFVYCLISAFKFSTNFPVREHDTICIRLESDYFPHTHDVVKASAS